MCRVLVFVLLAAVFPAIIRADENKTSCLNTTQLNATREELAKNWKLVVDNLVPNKTDEAISKITEYEKKIESYFKLANETCPQYDWNRQTETISAFLNASVEHISFIREFYSNNCSTLNKIFSKCFNDSNSGLTLKYMTYWERYNLNFNNHTCEVGSVVKDCSIKELEKDCPHTVNYVKLLYGVAESYCPKTPSTPSTTPTTGSAGLTAASSMLVITMPLILVQYLLTYQS